MFITELELAPILDLGNETYFFLIYPGYCSSCVGPLSEMIENIDSDSKNVAGILAKSSSLYENAFEKRNSKYFIDENRLLGKYGLDFSQSIFFHIKDSKLVTWEYITYGNLKKINKYINNN